MTPFTARRFLLWLVSCGLLLGMLVLLSPGVGTETTSVGWSDAWRARLGLAFDRTALASRPLADLDGDGVINDEELEGYRVVAAHIGFRQRLPRSLLALQVGFTLALCGATFQILFRNPLAEPYTLGIASGGALGALMAIRFGWRFTWTWVPAVACFAFLGGLAVVGAVFLMARGARRLTSNEILLAGVTLGLFCAAMMMLVTTLSDERQVFEVVRWMMGSLDPVSPLQSALILPLVLPAWVILLLAGRSLNQYRMGEELAAARGVHVWRLQGACVLSSTLATAAVVAYCGPIGFVGLVVPHIAVLLVGADCRILLPASAMLGGAFLMLSDWAAQFAMRGAGWLTGRQLGSATLPVGVVTAVIGVPLFLVLLRSRRSR